MAEFAAFVATLNLGQMKAMKGLMMVLRASSDMTPDKPGGIDWARVRDRVKLAGAVFGVDMKPDLKRSNRSLNRGLYCADVLYDEHGVSLDWLYAAITSC